MNPPTTAREVRTVHVVRLALKDGPTALSDALDLTRRAGGDARLHALIEADGRRWLHATTPAADAVVLALRDGGHEARLETAVEVVSEHADGALAHLVRTVEDAGVRVRASFGVTLDRRLRVVLHTEDDARAEDALRLYLDPGA